jgi:hypothetical protein
MPNLRAVGPCCNQRTSSDIVSGGIRIGANASSSLNDAFSSGSDRDPFGTRPATPHAPRQGTGLGRAAFRREVERGRRRLRRGAAHISRDDGNTLLSTRGQPIYLPSPADAEPKRFLTSLPADIQFASLECILRHNLCRESAFPYHHRFLQTPRISTGGLRAARQLRTW